jgi:hypothetical protein
MKELGYNFNDNIINNPFFDDCLRAFIMQGIEELNETQKQILKMLEKNLHFQVTGNGHCGSGKTTGTIFGILSNMGKNDKLICIKKFLKGGKGLNDEIILHINNLTDNKAVIVDADNMKTEKKDLMNANIILTSCLNVKSLFNLFIEEKYDNKIYILFDEAANIFNEQENDRLEEYEKNEDINREPFMRTCLYGIYMLKQNKINFITIFLSAVGDIPLNQIKSPSDIIEQSFNKWNNIKIEKITSNGINSIRHTRVFKVTKEGAFSIGGSTTYRDREVPLIYETMITIALNWLINGRLLFIMRRSQVDEFSKLLNNYIKSYGTYFMYTSDSNYWNDLQYNIIIVREDELKELEGRNISNIKAVYLFTIGNERNIPDKLQAMGRTGRLGQGVTWLFLFLDCCGTRNQTREQEAHNIIISSLNQNNSNPVKVIVVNDDSVLNSTCNDIPKLSINSKHYSKDELQIIMNKVNDANKYQVCKFLSNRYECMYKGRHCTWYHPNKDDFIKDNIVKPYLNISYCKKGLFRYR